MGEGEGTAKAKSQRLAEKVSELEGDNTDLRCEVDEAKVVVADNRADAAAAWGESTKLSIELEALYAKVAESNVRMSEQGARAIV